MNRVLAVGCLLFFLPWLFLLSFLEEKRLEKEESLSTLYRQLMLTELEDAYRDLDATRYVQNVLEELDIEENLISRKEGNVRHPLPGSGPPRRGIRAAGGPLPPSWGSGPPRRGIRAAGGPLPPSWGSDSSFFPARFIQERLKRLSESHGLRPFFFLTNGCNLRKARWWAREDFLRENDPQVVLGLANTLLLHCVAPQNYRIASGSARSSRNRSGSSFDLLTASMARAIAPGFDPDRTLSSPAELTPKNRFHLMELSVALINKSKEWIERVFGYFWNRSDLADGTARESYSEKLGNQNIITYSRCLFSSALPSRVILGGYAVFFQEDDLPLQRMLERALANPRQSHLFQRVLHVPTTTAGHASGEKADGCLTGRLPTLFSRLFPDRDRAPPELAIVLTRPPDDNPFSVAQSRVLLLGTLALLLWSAIRLISRFRPLPAFSLRWKLTAIISLTIVLPFIGLFVIAMRWLNGHGEDLPTRAQVVLERKTSFLAERIREWGKHRQLVAARVRPLLASFHGLPSSLASEKAVNLLERFVASDFVFYLDRNGAVGKTGGSLNPQRVDFSLVLARRLLGNLGFQLPADRKGKDMVANDFMDFFWNLHRTSEDISREGQESRYVFGVFENQHMEIFLVPAGSGSREIGGIAFVRYQVTKGFTDNLDALLNEGIALFHEASSLSTSRWGVFQISNLSKRETAWPWAALIDPLLSEPAEPGADSRGMNVTQRHLPGLWTLQTSSRATPYIFTVTGATELVSEKAFSGFSGILVGFLATYGALLVILAADLLSVLFLTPIRRLVDAAAAIGAGLFETSVPQDSGDEFEEMGRAFNGMARALRQREALRAFLPDRLVHQITSRSREGVAGKGENTEVIILCSDIRGFTALSEKTPPDLLVNGLNEYFTLMQDAITEEGGMILKLLGDAIVAVFYPDPDGRLPVEKAVSAARRMRMALREWNATRRSEGRFSLENGVGLAMGQALSGELGGREGRRDFTVIGAVVGEAAHLESLSATAGGSRIVVDRAIRRILPEREIVGEIREAPDSPAIGWEVAP